MIKNILLIGICALLFSSCKTFTSTKRTVDIPIQSKDITVIGFVRVQGKSVRKATSYDQLLTEARSKYNNDKVDVVNIKTDTYKASKKKIMNGLVILYVDKPASTAVVK